MVTVDTLVNLLVAFLGDTDLCFIKNLPDYIYDVGWSASESPGLWTIGRWTTGR